MLPKQFGTNSTFFLPFNLNFTRINPYTDIISIMAKPVFRYNSRRERNLKVRRNIGLILLFGGFWALLWLIMKRGEWIGWLKTFTY